MQRFAGMTFPVARFLVRNVFCILDHPTSDSQRISAREFGVWVRDLPTLMTMSSPVPHIHFDLPMRKMHPSAATTRKDWSRIARGHVLIPDLRSYQTDLSRQHDKKTNYLRIRRGELRVTRLDRDPSGTNDDFSVENDDDDNYYEDFFAFGGISNGLGSSKTASRNLLSMLDSQPPD
jgi:hypothetical protein